MKIKIPHESYTNVFEYIADHVNYRKDRFLYYDYSEFIYINAKIKGKIICPLHGEFWQNMNNHINGKGCPECGKINRIKKLSYIDFDEFLFYNRYKRADGFGYYNYSKVVLKNTHEKVEIICPVEGHGSFWQSIIKHVNGRGCPKCGKIKAAKKLSFNNFNEFLLANKHKRKDGFGYYNYSEYIFINTHTKGKIICPIEGHGSFYQSMNNHIKDQGCPKCAGVYVCKDVYEYIELNKYKCVRFTRDHDDFSKAVWKGPNKKIEIICGKCGNTYWQSMENYVKGKIGCSFCAHTAISKSSLIFFDTLHNKLVTDIPSLSGYIYYGHNNEVKVNNYRIDFAIIKDNIKIAVEYNGKYFHASPRMYLL